MRVDGLFAYGRPCFGDFTRTVSTICTSPALATRHQTPRSALMYYTSKAILWMPNSQSSRGYLGQTRPLPSTICLNQYSRWRGERGPTYQWTPWIIAVRVSGTPAVR